MIVDKCYKMHLNAIKAQKAIFTQPLSMFTIKVLAWKHHVGLWSKSKMLTWALLLTITFEKQETEQQASLLQ